MKCSELSLSCMFSFLCNLHAGSFFFKSVFPLRKLTIFSQFAGVKNVTANHLGEDVFVKHTLGTTFISCGKDVIKIIHYGADFYPVEVNLVALPFGMYTACFYITLPAYVGCLYKRC
ncbi:unnamed protein product [Natator depressus]